MDKLNFALSVLLDISEYENKDDEGGAKFSGAWHVKSDNLEAEYDYEVEFEDDFKFQMTLNNEQFSFDCLNDFSQPPIEL